MNLNKLLPYVVECQPMGGHFYEQIAAFNHEVIALRYARDCKTVNGQNEYKVTDLTPKHPPYVTVTRLGSGFAAIHLHWAEGEYYEPWQVGDGRYATREEAVPEARAWAAAEELEYRE